MDSPETPNQTPDDDSAEAASARPRPTFTLTPEQAASEIETFDDLPMHESIREAVRKIGWAAPTPVQKLCLPFTLRGRDVAGFAQTGTGKTAVFLITIVNKLMANPLPEGSAHVPRAIVLAPTRELAMQIEDDAQTILSHAGLVSMAVFGGIEYDKQARQLQDGVDVIVATPGRLMDYIRKKMVNLDQVQVFVCDEADRMFDMGFIDDVEFFLERIPEVTQKLLFSATTNDLVKELAFEYLETPEYISVNPDIITPEKIEQHGLHCHATQKLQVMLGMLREHNPECSIIFTNTKLTAEWLYHKLVGNGIEADLITGDLPQKKRIRLIQRIKEGQLKALIATDVASRGLHISRVTHVYNFDLPDDPSNYVHRIGRTARAGARGFAYSLVCDDYGQNLADIKTLLGNQASFTTEWPNEAYLTIEDKAGNPFEERYKARDAARAGYASGGNAGSRDGGGDRGPRRDFNDRGPRRDGGNDRGPRRDHPQQNSRPDGNGPGRPNGNGGGRPQENRGPRPDQNRNQGPGQGQGQNRNQGPGQGQQFADGGPDGGKKRRRRRKKGGGADGPQAEGQGGQQSGHRQGSQGQRHDRSVPATSIQGKPIEGAPKSFGGMIKKFVKTIFGVGK